MYLNNFMDRASPAQARLGTLEADLGMSVSFVDRCRLSHTVVQIGIAIQDNVTKSFCQLV